MKKTIGSIVVILLAVLLFQDIRNTPESNSNSKTIEKEEKMPEGKEKELFEAFLNGKEKVAHGERNKHIWELMQDYQGQYMYCDVDGDGEKELSIRVDDRFYTMDSDGTWKDILDFQWRDMDLDRQQGEEDSYFYNDSEIDREEWMEKTELYRNCPALEYDTWKEWKANGSRGKSAEFTDYAIYPSVITEENLPEKSPYLIWPTSIKLQFPQFYYFRESEKFDEETEVQINEKLFSGSVRNDTRDLVGRDNTDEKERNADYMIIMADENMFSIKYESYIYTVWNAYEFCNGVTVDIHTGECMKISDFVSVDESLIEKVKNEEIEYFSPGFRKEYVLYLLESFIEDYNNGSVDTYNCFYADEDYVYIVIPTIGGNSHYFTLKLERE